MTQVMKKPSQTMSTSERLLFAGIGSAIVLIGLRRSDRAGALAGLGGTALLGLAALGRDPLQPLESALGIRTAKDGAIQVKKAVTIGKSAVELYGFWRKLENLPQFMSHLESVTQTDATHSHWVARAPAGAHVSWDAEILEDVPNQRISWKSSADSSVPNEGSVEFRIAPGGDRGTEVHVELRYHPPLGALGATVARLFGEEPSQQIAQDLTRLKRILELGYLPTVEGQSNGRDSRPLVAALARTYDLEPKV